MAPRPKRKAAPVPEEEDQSAKRRFVESEAAVSSDDATPQEQSNTSGNDGAPIASADSTAESSTQGLVTSPSDKMAAMKAKFEALKARNRQGQKDNAREMKREQDRIKADPNFLKKLERQNAEAQQKLTKADMEAAGEDFERKRAWDWTVDESERWDRRMEGKIKNLNRMKFTDYTDAAEKVYDRQLNTLKPDLDLYQRQKLDSIQKAIESGELQLAETGDGEVVAIDKSGNFGMNKQLDFSHKPTAEAINGLVEDLKKAEDVRLRNRMKRQKAIMNEDGDVTYINKTNQQFNAKLGRFYDKYTTELRENLERGTAI